MSLANSHVDAAWSWCWWRFTTDWPKRPKKVKMQEIFDSQGFPSLLWCNCHPLLGPGAVNNSVWQRGVWLITISCKVFHEETSRPYTQEGPLPVILACCFFREFETNMARNKPHSLADSWLRSEIWYTHFNIINQKEGSNYIIVAKHFGYEPCMLWDSVRLQE